MKLYGFSFAPNPRKVLTYLREKGIPFEYVHVDLPGGEHRRPPFSEKNPMQGLPIVELEGGRILTESLAIIEYLEELHPEPAMIGTDPLSRHHVRAMERLCEASVLARVGRIFRNSHPLFAGPDQIPAVAEQARRELPDVLAKLGALTGDEEFVAGPTPTIADCTLFAAFELARVGDIALEDLPANLDRWWMRFRARPSAAQPPMG